MTKLFLFFSNPWTLFALSILCFSVCGYLPLTGMFIVWGIGLLIAAVVRFVVVGADSKANLFMGVPTPTAAVGKWQADKLN